MDVHAIQAEETAKGVVRLSATVGATEVFFSIEGAPGPLRFSYDPFVLTGAMTAMEGEGRLTVAGDAPASTELLVNLSEYSGIQTQWWGDLTGLEIEAERQEAGTPARSGFVGSFFSGGVDSLYTYIQNKETISHLILCQGLDISFREPERWEKAVVLLREFAEAEGKGLVLVRTNAKKLQSTKGARNHGAILISAGMALGFDSLLVPASNALTALRPYGSHPILDPFCSNGATEVIHDSPLDRPTKLRGILKAGIGIERLRVCNVQTDKVNCGWCEKCLRTRTVLTLLGGAGAHLKPLDSAKDLRRLRFRSIKQAEEEWEVNRALAEEVGRHDIAREIHRAMRRIRTKEAFKQFDQDYLGGAFLRFRRSFQGR